MRKGTLRWKAPVVGLSALAVTLGVSLDLVEGQSSQSLTKALQEQYPGLELYLSGPSRSGIVTLSKIVIPKESRGEGVGSKVMKAILSWADQAGHTLALTPSKQWGGSVGRLKTFYKRFGFVMNKGRKKDYEISELMYRHPSE